MLKWVEYRKQGKLPLERRSVLVTIQSSWPRPAVVAVGYIRIQSGGPFFVVPGVPHEDEDITHWCDCLGDDFKAPHWQCRQVVGSPRRQWDGRRHVRAVTSAERFGHAPTA